MSSSGYVEAFQAFRDPIQAAISCVTTAQIRGNAFPMGQVYTFDLTERRTPLGRRSDFLFTFGHSFQVVSEGRGADRWHVQTTSYSYWLHDIEGHELLLYQWVTDGPSPVKTPHLHLGKALAHRDLPQPLRDRVGLLVNMHLPTGFIPFTSILRATIDDLGVAPLRRNRADVDRILNEADGVLRSSFAWRTE